MEKKMMAKAIVASEAMSYGQMLHNTIGISLIFQGLSSSKASEALEDEFSKPIFTLKLFLYDSHLSNRISMGLEVFHQSSNQGALLYTTKKEQGGLGLGYSIDVDVEGIANFKRVVKALCPNGVKYFSVEEVKNGIDAELISYKELNLALQHCVNYSKSLKTR
jgi:hypothetical protein